LVTDLDHDLDRARLLGCADHASYIGLGYLGGAAWHLSLSLYDLADCGGHHAAARDDGLAPPLHLWGADEFSELAVVSSDPSARRLGKFAHLGLLHGLRNNKGRRGGGLHRHGWIDRQLGAVNPHSPFRLAARREAIIGPLRNVYGVGDSVTTI
jgi:hypothetical protein